MTMNFCTWHDVNNDVISDVSSEHNVSKVYVICYNLVLILVFKISLSKIFQFSSKIMIVSYSLLTTK